MSSSVQIEKITGVPSKGTACSVYKKRVDLKDGKSGTIVSLFLAEGKESTAISEVSSDIFDAAVGKLEETEGGVLEALNSSLSIASTLASSNNLNISFAHLFFFEGASFIVKSGEKVKVYVFSPPKSLEITFESGSGPISKGQIYLVATEAFLSIFDTSVFAKEDAQIDFREVFDGLATEVSAEKNQSEIGAAVAYIEDVDEEVVSSDKEEEKEEGGKEETKEETEKDDTSDVDEEKSLEEAAHEEKVSEENKSTDEETLLEAKQGKFGLITGVFGYLTGFSKNRNFKALFTLRRNIILVAILILIILVGSAFFTVRQRKQGQKMAEFENHYSSASSKYSEAVAIIDLNKSKARGILVDAQKEVKLALESFPNDKDANNLESEISRKLKETEVNSNVNFETLAEVDNAVVSLGFSQGNVVGISGSMIYEVDENGDISKVDGSSGTISGFVFDDKAFLMSRSEVKSIDLETGSEKEVASSGGAEGISVFIGNVYMLYSSRIDKYVPVEGGYFGPSDYLNGEESFGANPSFAIDGSVWVSREDKIFKFTRGEKEDFEVDGDFGKFGIIYTDSNLDNLYVVDKDNSALLVFDKNGGYKKAYQSPEFSKASDIIISSDEKQMYVASGSKILRADL